jgi:hypothetical protein
MLLHRHAFDLIDNTPSKNTKFNLNTEEISSKPPQ